MSFVIINIGSQDRVVHSLFSAWFGNRWITQCCAVDNFGFWRLLITLVLLWITLLIGVFSLEGGGYTDLSVDGVCLKIVTFYNHF